MNSENVSLRMVLGVAGIGVAAGVVAMLFLPMMGAGSTHISGVEYQSEYDCRDYETQNGHLLECSASVSVTDLANAEYVEVRTVDGVSSATEMQIIYSTENGAGGVTMYEDGDSDLQYWDVVIVEAVLESGETVVLEMHEFSCEDADKPEGCNNG